MPMKIAKAAFATLTIVFLVAPLIAILPLAFTSSVILTYPIPSWSLRWFEELFFADAWRRAIVNSLIIGTGTTLLATVLGTAASLGLRNRLILFRGTVRTLFLLPMVVPAVVLGVGMQVLLARFGLTNSYLGVIIAHTVVAVPFVVVSGMWGMNFQKIPLQNWPHGFWLLLVIQLGLGGALLYFLRRRRLF